MGAGRGAREASQSALVEEHANRFTQHEANKGELGASLSGELFP